MLRFSRLALSAPQGKIMAEKVAIEDTFEAPVEERRRTYETTIVLSSKAGEEGREALLGKIRSYVADAGGEIIEVSPAKEFPLAYPINKERQGVMRTLVYKSKTDLPNDLARELRHETALLRMLTIEQPKRPVVKPRLAFSPMPKTTDEAEAQEAESAVSTEDMEAQIEGAISNL